MGGRIGSALLAVMALAACAGGPSPVGSRSPTPDQPSPSPIASPAYTPLPPTPAPSPRPPRSEMLHCRLPISAGTPGSGGFIVFPGGKYVADPKSNVVIPNVPTPSPSYGYNPGNFFGLTYSRTYSRWLPVPRQFVTPDEAHYVYTSPDSVYVVSVASGAKIELGASLGHPWSVLEVDNRASTPTRCNRPRSRSPACGCCRSAVPRARSRRRAIGKRSVAAPPTDSRCHRSRRARSRRC
jgi:hypothetical protein